MKEFKTFETERLLIRPTTVEDAEFIFELLNSPKWLQFIGDRNVKNLQSAVEYIHLKITPQLNRLGYSNYTIIRKSDQTKIGTCGLYDRDGVVGIDIGFAFLPNFENHGYAFEATNKLKEAAFHEFGLPEINAITTKDNYSSQKLLEKLGMKKVGTTQLPYDNEELLLYQIKF